MSDHQQDVGWWRASDGRWYPPEMHPNRPPVRMTIEPRRRTSPWVIVLAVLCVPLLLGILAGVVVFALGGVREVAEEAVQEPVEAAGQAAACRTELLTIRTSIAAYTADNGVPPVNEEELVTAQFLVAPSANYDIGAGGTVVQQAGSACPPP